MPRSTPIERCIQRSASSNGLLGSVSERFGLMPAVAPSAHLPSALQFIDDCIADLPRLFRRGRVCRRLMDLPAVPEPLLVTLEREEMLRLSMAYGFMAYSFRYAWEHGRERLLHGGEPWHDAPASSVTSADDRFAPTQGTIAKIRSNILLPWRTLCHQMGREQPCFEADFFTRNFCVIEGSYAGVECVGQDSCELLFSMFGSETERVFFLGVQEVTARFHCLPALIRMQRAMAEYDHASVIAAVDQVAALWREVVEDVFMRFDTRIDPADWAATVGTWTASPFPGRDGFSGMFFPAFHLLDVLLGRVRYASMMGKLIVHTRGELLPAWRDLFDAIGERDLRTYCDRHGREHPELLRAMIQLQDAYQHFFLLHRRKVFAFEYQGIVTGRNSTNAGISVDIKDRTVESVFSLATWNQIDDLLSESGMERPLEALSNADKCPFSGGALAEDAPKNFPTAVAVRCPFSGKASAAGEGASERASALPDWRPLPPSEPPLHGVVLESLPSRPQVGDRVALWLDADGREQIEGDFIGALVHPYQVRTPVPVHELHRVVLLPGLFARMPGAGARARQTKDAPVLVIAQGRHSVFATVLAPHVRGEFFVILEGEEVERDIVARHGVPRAAIAVTKSLENLSVDDAAEACGRAGTNLRAARNQVLIYVSGDPAFVKRANAWVERAFLEPHEPIAEFLAGLRVTKRYRPIVQASALANEASAVMYPWDVIGARRYPLRVALEGRVLDLTRFQAMHYGGTPILRMLAGTDISAEFGRAHPQGQIRMPEVFTVASLCIPRGLEKLTQLAFVIARSANVLSLLDEMLGAYRSSVRARTQRLCRVLEALDIETLWSQALAKACGTDIPPKVQQALRASHARSLAVLESTLRSRDMTDLSATFALQYTGLYENVLQNLVRGLRESAPTPGKPIELDALSRCFDRHIQILLELISVTRVVDDVPSELTLPMEVETEPTRPTA
jgi:hypothetical protein